MTVEGSVVMVTGAAGGLGWAVTQAFVNAGARVAIMDANVEALAELDDDACAVAGADNVLALPGDIADPDYIADAVDRTIERFGRIDVLINSAGLGMGVIRPDHMDNLIGIDEVDADVWRQFIDVNLTGPFLLIKAVAPHMRAQGRGRIIAITTSFFTMLRDGFSPYSASKAGLEVLLSGLAREFKDSGITVNIVVPGGPADTPMVPLESGFDRADLIRPEAMAPPMLWLASPAADAVTGRRYIAANWDTQLPPEEAAKRAGDAIGWPELTKNVVWPTALPE